ncbi:AAA family ATPase [Chitinophaga solisilvae]|uniref:AAA family ATPase n=1 Tax=Chitinophaga solisilvae TaxID=1233460 RepID=UPI00136ED55E|nr:AAA family ATPase [Chitinophaga solisilvae]
MKTVLITGMSGTGKTSTILELQARGFTTADLDSAAYSVWADAGTDPDYPDNEVKEGKDWIWDESRVEKLLTADTAELLFVSGCASNMSRFYPYFDYIVLLTAPDHVILDRLASRGSNSYGCTPEEAARVLRLIQTIEPLLRDDADLEIDTGIPGQSAVDVILAYIGVRNF